MKSINENAISACNKSYYLSRRVPLGSTGLLVSPAGFGALAIGPNQRSLSPIRGGELIALAVSRGINFIDTAQCYGTYAHVRAGLDMIFSSDPGVSRSDLVICSKSLAADYQSMTLAVDEALEALGLEYIDIFLMHEVRSGGFSDRSGAWQALTDLKAAGKIQAIGVSTHHADIAGEMAGVPECDLVFGLINYAGMGIRRAMTNDEQAALSPDEKRSLMIRHGCLDMPGTPSDMLAAASALKAAGKGFFAMKAFGGGNLTGNYIHALDFIFSHPEIDALMVGMASERDLTDLLDYISGRLPADYRPDISLKRVHINQEDCEGCGSCIRACASQAISFNARGQSEIDPARCLTCGYCAPVCPVRAIIMY